MGEVKAAILGSRELVTTRFTLPGTVFAISAAPVDVDDDSTNSHDAKPSLIGYDGEAGIVYMNRRLYFLNDYVCDKLAISSREDVLSWGVVESDERASMGRLVENLVWADLKSGSSFRIWNMAKKEYEDNWSIDLSTDKLVDLDGVTHVFAANQVVRMVKNSALIDFAGPGKRVYQLTLQENHKMNREGMRKVLLAGGYLRIRNGVIEVSLNADKLPKLDFFWVIPYRRESQWKNKAPKTFNGEGLLPISLKTFVNQHVMIVDAVPPTKAAMYQQ